MLILEGMTKKGWQLEMFSVVALRGVETPEHGCDLH